MDGYFHNYYDGKIYYTGNFRNVNTPSQQAGLLYFDTADNTEKTLLETIPLDTYSIDVTAPFSPALLLACTAAGQWLTAATPRDSYDPQYSLYALWDPADFLADGQPLAWVTMYATE